MTLKITGQCVRNLNFLKIFDFLLTKYISCKCNNIFVTGNGFLQHKYTITSLTSYQNIVLPTLEKRIQVEAIIRISIKHSTENIFVLINKLVVLGFYGPVLQWLRDFLSNRTQNVT